MPFGTVLLILSFIYYNFGGWTRVTLSSPPKIVAFFGMERVNPFQPPKILAYEGQN
jgi:hypothetical protein